MRDSNMGLVVTTVASDVHADGVMESLSRRIVTVGFASR